MQSLALYREDFRHFGREPPLDEIEVQRFVGAVDFVSGDAVPEPLGVRAYLVLAAGQKRYLAQREPAPSAPRMRERAEYCHRALRGRLLHGAASLD